MGLTGVIETQKFIGFLRILNSPSRYGIQNYVHLNVINFFSLAVDTNRFAHISDNELMEQYYATHDNEMLGALLQRYTLLLLGVCMKYLKNEEEAKDSVQQIFLKVITEVKKYKVTYFKSWLYMIARNYCLMLLRDKHGRVVKELNESLAITEDADIKTNIVEKDKVLDHIEEALNELNEEQKSCVILFYLQKRSYQEISERTGFSLLQVKSYIQNGKRNLKLLVDKKMKMH